MSDYLTRSFRAQVNTTIDSIMRTTVHEVTQIFENSLKDYKVELSQKGEEIIRLQMKLQAAEMKLKVLGDGADMSAEGKESHPSEVQTASRQIPDDCKIDAEEPDDWCAPLGCESWTRDDHAVCPSVRLRPLSIPLWHIPIKQEAHGDRYRTSQLTSHGRRSRRILSSSNSSSGKRGSEMECLLRAVKPEMCDIPVTLSRRLRGRNVPVAEERKLTKSHPVTEPGSEEDTVTTDVNKTSPCKFCHRVFDTEFGLYVHTRSHKKCSSCRKACPTLSALRYHQRSCKKFQKMLAEKGTRHPTQTHETHEEHKQTSPSEKLTITKKSSPTSDKHRLSSVPNETSDKRKFACNMCPRKFKVKRALNQHKTKMHKVRMRCIDVKGEPSWTWPLEGSEDTQENSGFPNKDASQAVNHDDNQHSSKHAEKQQATGTQCSNGFICPVCKKVLKTKFLLSRHIRIHKGEKPFECLVSGSCFVPKKLVCKHCGMMFRSHNSHKQHVLRFHKIWPHACSYCGKGFCTAGRLNSHYERFHVNAKVEVTV